MSRLVATFSIDLKKLVAKHFVAGKKKGDDGNPISRYANFALIEKRNEEYDQDGFVVQSVSKAAREAGEQGPIVGNFKLANRAPATTEPVPRESADVPKDDVPF